MTDEQTPEPPDFEQRWRDALSALRILGREVRALRARLDREAS